MKRKAVIFDMDGTLADVSSIRYLVRDPKHKNFDRFHELSVDVPPNEWVVRAARLHKSIGYDVIIVTARKHMWRHQTAWFLALHDIPSDVLFMRGNKDNRPDYEVKRDILYVIQQEWEVFRAWDDNPNIIRLWQEHGIETIVVEGWEYD